MNMRCNRCGKDNPDGSKYCIYCGNKLSEEKKRDISKVILVSVIVCTLLVCILAVVLMVRLNTNKGTVIDKTASGTEERKKTDDNMATPSSAIDDSKENILNESETTSGNGAESEVEEEMDSKHYYLVKSISNKYNDGRTETFEYDFDSKTVKAGGEFTGDLMHPEVDVPYYEQDITWYFYPKSLFPYIEKYKLTYEDELLGEENLHFDGGDLESIVITDYEFDLGETYNCTIDSKDENEYVLKDKHGKVYLTYDHEGCLVNVNNGDRLHYNIDFSYDSKGRLTRIYRTEDIFITTNTFEYNESDNTAYEYVEGEESPLNKYYYDSNNVCYKKVDLSDNSETTYEYIDVEVSGETLQIKDYSIENNVEENTDYSSLLDDYYNVLRQVYNGDRSEVDAFVEKYDIEGDIYSTQDIFGYGYAYRDINDDGVDELFVCSNMEIASVYTIKDGRIINLINGWSRNNVYLCSDNTFYSFGSGGAACSLYTSYKMNASGDALDVKDKYVWDATDLMINEYEYDGNSYEDDVFWTYSTSEEYTPGLVNTTYQEAQAFINEQESKIILVDTTPLSEYKDEMVMDSFYGIWCYGSKNKEDAIEFMDNYDGYLIPQVFLSTDWDNLNSETYYVVTLGVYRTKEEAEAELDSIQDHYYPDAYVKYSGEYIGK